MFGFHSLAVEDCVDPAVNPPKIDDYGNYVFALFHGVNQLSDANAVETVELALFVGHNDVVTNHSFPLFSVEEVRRQVDANGHPMERGAEFLLYTIIDTLVDNVLPSLDRMSEVATAVEEEALKSPHSATLDAILRPKRSTRRTPTGQWCRSANWSVDSVEESSRLSRATLSCTSAMYTTIWCASRT